MVHYKKIAKIVDCMLADPTKVAALEIYMQKSTSQLEDACTPASLPQLSGARPCQSLFSLLVFC